jgi:hypothetical protein
MVSIPYAKSLLSTTLSTLLPSESALPGPYGIFGSFTMLTLIFDRPLHRRRVIAQDLAGDQSMDITDRVSIDGRSLRLADADLRMVGLHAATDGDLSSPGMILALR